MTQIDDTLLDRLHRWERGETPGPWYVVSFPTNLCNLNCVMCWRHGFRYDPKVELPDERQLELVDECAALGCREWFFLGGGEPLVRASLLMRMCERIRHHGMIGRLQTNATLLALSQIQTLVEIGWNHITFSLDGPTSDINDPIRGNGSFDRATAAIAQCAAVRREAKARSPRIVLHVTVTRHNHDVLAAMVDLGHRLGCDRVEAELCLGDWSGEHKITPEQRQELPDGIGRANQRALELGIESDFDCLLLSPWTERRGRVLGRPPDVTSGVLGSLCFDPWYCFMIFADGRTGPCPCSWSNVAPKITDCQVKEIWEGPYFAEARQRMVRNEPPAYCLECPAVLYKHTNDTLDAMRDTGNPESGIR
jgi:MoaA/NifB/PqqE/SkfB family radical SAM enzyme